MSSSRRSPRSVPLEPVSVRDQSDMSVPPVLPPTDPIRIISKEAAGNGSGYRYKLELRNGQIEMKAASKVRQSHKALVEAYEAAQRQQPGPQHNGPVPIDVLVPVDPVVSGSDAIAEQLRLSERLREEMAEQLRQLRAAASPVVREREREHGPATSVFGKPRAQDLREYDGTSSKLDGWLAELCRTAELYALSDRNTVLLGVSRFVCPALIWRQTMSATERATHTSLDTLAAALIKRFQPITTAETTRTQLDALTQGTRHINEYISEFQRLSAMIGAGLGEDEAKHAFVRGLRVDIATQLRVSVSSTATLSEMISSAARIGMIVAPTPSASSSYHTQRNTGTNRYIHQLDGADQPETCDTAARFAQLEAQLHTLQAQHGTSSYNTPHGAGSSTGPSSGPYTHPQRTGRGWFGARRGGVGAHRGGRGGSSRSSNGARPPPQVPGVSADEVQRRWDARVCIRCGEDGHRAISCPNSISTQSSKN